MIPIIAAMLLFVTMTGVDSPVVISILYAVIVIISFASAAEYSYRSPKNGAMYIILSVFGSFSMLIFAIGMHATQWRLMAATIFIAWSIKTILVRPLRSDTFDPSYYFYGVLPAKGIIGSLNIAKPSSMADFGGRVVIGGGWVWCVHKGHFVKIPLSRINKSSITMVNTWEPVNDSTTKALNGMVGSKAIYWLKDCASIRCADSLESVVIRRFLRRICERMKK